MGYVDKMASILKGESLFSSWNICTLTTALLLLLCLLFSLCVADLLILSAETYSGTFHDAAQEEQVDVFGARRRGRGRGSRTRVVQNLLHG